MWPSRRSLDNLVVTTLLVGWRSHRSSPLPLARCSAHATHRGDGVARVPLYRSREAEPRESFATGSGRLLLRHPRWHRDVHRRTPQVTDEQEAITAHRACMTVGRASTIIEHTNLIDESASSIDDWMSTIDDRVLVIAGIETLIARVGSSIDEQACTIVGQKSIIVDVNLINDGHMLITTELNWVKRVARPVPRRYEGPLDVVFAYGFG